MKKQLNKLKNLQPLLASAGGALIAILAFLLPSVQDQWDRLHARTVITQYVELGNELFDGEKYAQSEKAYEKAFELSDKNRLDIEVKRLTAKINRINDEPDWGSKPPEDFDEVDFQFLLRQQKGVHQKKLRAATLNCYGLYLSSVGRTNDALGSFGEAINLSPKEPHLYINIGNLYEQMKRQLEAEKSYRRALELDPGNATAHYDLGLLYESQGRMREAKNELGAALKFAPGEQSIIDEYARLRHVK